MSNEFLFYLGLLAAGTAAAGGLLAAVLVRGAQKRLDARLDIEYGKKRR